jgi:Ca2+-binding RTX toxin-like protein
VAGAAAYQFFGGSGTASVVAGSGNNIAFGSQGSGTTYLQAGSGNDTLVGGAGSDATKLVGGNNTYEFASRAGPTTMMAGTGVTLANGQAGSGAELGITGAGYDILALNNANDTVVGGSGTSVILGGLGQDIYGFLNGHAGVNETIYNLNASDRLLSFGGYGGSPKSSEEVGASGDVLHLTDGTVITLAGIGHTGFT